MSAEALVSLPCSISYSVGLFAGRVWAGICGACVGRRRGERASGGGEREKKEEEAVEKLCCWAVVGHVVSC